MKLICGDDGRFGDGSADDVWDYGGHNGNGDDGDDQGWVDYKIFVVRYNYSYLKKM